MLGKAPAINLMKEVLEITANGNINPYKSSAVVLFQTRATRQCRACVFFIAAPLAPQLSSVGCQWHPFPCSYFGCFSHFVLFSGGQAVTPSLNKMSTCLSNEYQISVCKNGPECMTNKTQLHANSKISSYYPKNKQNL